MHTHTHMHEQIANSETREYHLQAPPSRKHRDPQPSNIQPQRIRSAMQDTAIFLYGGGVLETCTYPHTHTITRTAYLALKSASLE